jgi:hypothetical protein
MKLIKDTLPTKFLVLFVAHAVFFLIWVSYVHAFLPKNRVDYSLYLLSVILSIFVLALRALTKSFIISLLTLFLFTPFILFFNLDLGWELFPRVIDRFGQNLLISTASLFWAPSFFVLIMSRYLKFRSI